MSDIPDAYERLGGLGYSAYRACDEMLSIAKNLEVARTKTERNLIARDLRKAATNLAAAMREHCGPHSSAIALLEIIKL